MRTEIGRLTSRSAKLYKVLWDILTREVWVQRSTALGGDPFLKCPAKTETAEDAMHIASAFLYDK
jgi:hypothetical protein